QAVLQRESLDLRRHTPGRGIWVPRGRRSGHHVDCCNRVPCLAPNGMEAPADVEGVTRNEQGFDRAVICARVPRAEGASPCVDGRETESLLTPHLREESTEDERVSTAHHGKHGVVRAGVPWKHLARRGVDRGNKVPRLATSLREIAARIQGVTGQQEYGGEVV